mgnify:FL=1
MNFEVLQWYTCTTVHFTKAALPTSCPKYISYGNQASGMILHFVSPTYFYDHVTMWQQLNNIGKVGLYNRTILNEEWKLWCSVHALSREKGVFFCWFLTNPKPYAGWKYTHGFMTLPEWSNSYNKLWWLRFIYLRDHPTISGI